MKTTKTATKKQIAFTLAAIETLEASGLRAHLLAHVDQAALLARPYVGGDVREFGAYLVLVACGI